MLSSRLGNESHNFLTDFAGTHKNSIKGGAVRCEWPNQGELSFSSFSTMWNVEMDNLNLARKLRLKLDHANP